MNKTPFLVIVLLFVGFFESTFAQTFTLNDYRKALWMTTRFYGAQRSGEHNWTLHNHLHTGGNEAIRGLAFRADRNTTDNVDLSGGWHDCGDHVKFGQTQFYSAYVLLKGYSEFPAGYGDWYTYQYTGYKNSGQYNYEGTGHDPNCIPDVLEEVKHATDFFIKCTPNGTTFWYQVGNGGCPGDHCRWETAVKMQTNDVNNGGNNDNGTPGARRPSCKNPNDGSMAAHAGATLALMARLYEPYDAAYAALCLTHAVNAYNYARTRTGNVAGTCFGGFYPAARDARDAFVSCCAELYWTTNNAAYRTEAFTHEAGVSHNVGWSFDYANHGELGLYNLAKLGNASALTRFNNRITGHYLAAGSRNGAGVYTAYGTWGRLRYNGNAAFLIALYSKLNNNTTAAVLNAIYNDVDYIMGKNGPKRSYIVGFEPAAGGPYITPQYPHHRNAYLRDDNPGNATVITIPAKNRQLGALVGGQRDGTYNDDRNDYVNSEVCVDYNAGLVGALAFINERLSPFNISCATCRQPNLGPDLSTCSGTTLPVTLNANAGAAGGSISYRWYTWNGATKTLIAGATSQTYNANSLGGYIVERDSSYAGGPCTKRDTIWIRNVISKPNLGPDPAALCSPAFVNLAPSNTSSFPAGTTWQWQFSTSLAGPYSNLYGATSSTYNMARVPGFYRLVATAGSCTNSDTIRITSNNPTPVDACINSSGVANLSITNASGTNYNWYSTATGGSPLAGGTGTLTFSTSVSTTTTFYVQNMNAAAGNVGPATTLGAGTNWGISAGNQLHFTAHSNFTINSFKIPWNIYSDGSGQITVEVLDGSGNPLVPARTFTSNATTVTTGNGQLIQFNFTGFNIESAWGPNLRMRLTSKGSINGDPLWSAGPASYNYCYPSCASPIVSITGESGGSGANEYMYFYDWNIQTGSPCDRLPVIARVGGCETPTPVILFSFGGELVNGSAILNWSTASESNSKFFEIQKSSNPESGFSTIGSVPAAGNSSKVLTYNFMDENPAIGVNYYRLKQVDKDGSEEFSNVISVVWDEPTIHLAPNPFTKTTRLKVSMPSYAEVEIRVLDLSGKPLAFLNGSSSKEFELGEELAEGMYLVQIRIKDKIYFTKMIKG
ncbi:MAG: glycoside hydrolase family 9 protein [Cytophagaceae bacterium]